MARINIEDRLYKDIRYKKFCEKTKNRHIAIGCLVEAWTLAQEYWKVNKRPVPITVFMELDHAQDILDCKLAIIDEDDSDFVYVKGSKACFEWLLKCSEAGKKGGRPKNDVSTAHDEIIEENEKGAKGRKRHSKPSSSYSYSNSLKNKFKSCSNEPNLVEQSSTKLSFDFLKLYQKYPRKEGKQKGLNFCKAQIKTQEDYDKLSQAIDVYTSLEASKGTEKKFIKLFSTFMSNGTWKDYLDSDIGKVNLVKSFHVSEVCKVCDGLGYDENHFQDTGEYKFCNCRKKL